MDNQQPPKETKKHTAALKFFLILIALGIMTGVIYLKINNISLIDFLLAYQSKYVTSKVVENISFDMDSKSSFALLKNSYVHCTKDGIKYSGANEWNETFTLSAPTMISEGNIIAVTEFNSKTVYVFNENGKMYSITSNAPIVQFAVNKLGYLAIITKNIDEHIIELYSPSGNLITKRFEGNEQKAIYPIAIDISDDGKFMAVSYLDTNDTVYTSKILFFGTSKQAEAELGADSIVNAGIQGDKQVIFSLKYMNNNTLIAISDKKIIAINQECEEIWNFNLTNEIVSLDFNEGNSIIIAFGNELPGSNAFKPGTVVWYDLSGKQLSSYEIDSDIKFMTSKDKRLLVYAENSIYSITQGGKLFWHHIVLQDVDQMLLFDNLSTILLKYKNSAQIVDIKARLIKPDELDETESESTDETNTETQESNENSQGTEANTESGSEIETIPETEESSEPESESESTSELEADSTEESKDNV